MDSVRKVTEVFICACHECSLLMGRVPPDRQGASWQWKSVTVIGLSHSIACSSSCFTWSCSELLQPSSCQVKKGMTKALLHGWHVMQLLQKPVPSNTWPSGWPVPSLRPEEEYSKSWFCWLFSLFADAERVDSTTLLGKADLYFCLPDFCFHILLVTTGKIMKVFLTFSKVTY